MLNIKIRIPNFLEKKYISKNKHFIIYLLALGNYFCNIKLCENVLVLTCRVELFYHQCYQKLKNLQESLPLCLN